MQLRLCIIVVLALLSQGCGRKGPLVLPASAHVTHTAASSVPLTQTQH